MPGRPSAPRSPPAQGQAQISSTPHPKAYPGGWTRQRTESVRWLFVQQQTIVPRKFTATGPVANAGIDAVAQAMMRPYPTVRHAALAIVHGTKLVYARGYTLAEPDWPIVQPTTFFRLASVSKAVTALAVFQLLETGALDAATSVQDILELSAPGGGPPNPGFASVTIQSLLEHTSGLDDGSGWGIGTTVVAAFIKAGIPASLPVTQEMTDSYIASRPLVSRPGKSPEVQQLRLLPPGPRRRQSPGVYYGQKGGLIEDAASVFEFDGEWGFVALFGSSAYRPNNSSAVYPDWHGVMDQAETHLATAIDLLPQFGMPSL